MHEQVDMTETDEFEEICFRKIEEWTVFNIEMVGKNVTREDVVAAIEWENFDPSRGAVYDDDGCTVIATGDFDVFDSSVEANI